MGCHRHRHQWRRIRRRGASIPQWREHYTCRDQARSGQQRTRAAIDRHSLLRQWHADPDIKGPTACPEPTLRRQGADVRGPICPYLVAG